MKSIYLSYLKLVAMLLITVLVFLCSNFKSTTAQEVENEREFDYMSNSGMGPRHWGDLKKEWEACKNGNLQSPIDLTNQRIKVIKKLVKIQKKYRACNATVKNRGHDIALQWEGLKAGFVHINGTQYFLQQSHWHSPSEHTINGRRYDLELHMVHISTDRRLAVIGLLYKLGHPDPFLAKLLGDIVAMSDQKMERSMGIVDPGQIKIGGKKYYRYLGSLTVPPCTEGVIWTINKKQRTVSTDQVILLRQAVHDYAEQNSRPVQPRNSREVELYGHN